MRENGLTLTFTASTVTGNSGWNLPLTYNDGDAYILPDEIQKVHSINWSKEEL